MGNQTSRVPLPDTSSSIMYTNDRLRGWNPIPFRDRVGCIWKGEFPLSRGGTRTKRVVFLKEYWEFHTHSDYILMLSYMVWWTLEGEWNEPGRVKDIVWMCMKFSSLRSSLTPSLQGRSFTPMGWVRGGSGVRTSPFRHIIVCIDKAIRVPYVVKRIYR